jgi:adenosylcobinamide-GDP ribazoletransferase
VKAADGAFDLREQAGGWPLAGLLLAVTPAAVVVINDWLGIPALVTAFLALAAAIGVTGALHEDGLADTFDGIGARSSRVARLSAMRDSRIGTFGVLALLLAILVRGSAIATLAIHPGRAVLALLAGAVISRALALWHWSAIPTARRDGMAFSAGQPDSTALQLGALTGAIAALFLVVALGFAGVLGILLAVLSVGLFNRICWRLFGGHTGDTIGAAQQISETLLFAGLSAAATTIAV